SITSTRYLASGHLKPSVKSMVGRILASQLGPRDKFPLPLQANTHCASTCWNRPKAANNTANKMELKEGPEGHSFLTPRQ
ncbi:MAG: hypothetical protein KA251_09075, partial [Saprospiraceae bacterium]|nr:hypothetical protein [Saprospiraceae bacterium]